MWNPRQSRTFTNAGREDLQLAVIVGVVVGVVVPFAIFGSGDGAIFVIPIAVIVSIIVSIECRGLRTG